MRFRHVHAEKLQCFEKLEALFPTVIRFHWSKRLQMSEWYNEDSARLVWARLNYASEALKFIVQLFTVALQYAFP